MDSLHAIAVNRFGLGARGDEPPPADPKRWLIDQLGRFDPRPTTLAGIADARTAMTAVIADRLAARDLDPVAKRAARQSLRKDFRAGYLAAVDARATAALTTPAPFIERLVHFWANHFAVSADKAVTIPFIGAFEVEAIRPHVLGRFADMLFAVERHPAMQLYLDQARSVGPDSAAAQRAALAPQPKRRGLNENLAREIMELHTLGVRTGYTQADVTEFARALTGWSIAGTPRDTDPPGSFVFRGAVHEPGTRTIRGRRYDQAGEAQAAAVLDDLAAAPETATHLATKLARHFAGDVPPPALVGRIAQTFTRTGGDLPSVYRVLIDAPECWVPTPVKFKTPWEWSISALRGLGTKALPAQRVAPMLQQLGQPVWRPGAPAGYDDIAASWAAPDALLRRVEVAQRLGERAGTTTDARALAPRLLALSPATAAEIARAESPATGIALLLASPDFLRR